MSKGSKLIKYITLQGKIRDKMIKNCEKIQKLSNDDSKNKFQNKELNKLKVRNNKLYRYYLMLGNIMVKEVDKAYKKEYTKILKMYNYK